MYRCNSHKDTELILEGKCEFKGCREERPQPRMSEGVARRTREFKRRRPVLRLKQIFLIDLIQVNHSSARHIEGACDTGHAGAVMEDDDVIIKS